MCGTGFAGFDNDVGHKAKAAEPNQQQVPRSKDFKHFLRFSDRLNITRLCQFQ